MTAPSPPGRRGPRIVHFAGPGDLVGTFGHWRRGEADPSEVSVTYSGQFFDACERLGADVLLVGCHREARSAQDGRFRVVHRPIPWSRSPGVRYHLGRLWNGVRMIASAARFRADVAIVAMGTHWFLLSALRLLGVRIVPTLHNTLWPRARGDAPPRGVLAALDAWFFRRCCAAVLVASDDIARQVRLLTRGRHAPLVEFLPTYAPDTFRGVAPPDPRSSPFRVLFLGRIERDKGVFDLLEACRGAVARGLDVRFDLCGDGSAAAELRAAVDAAGVAHAFVLHGHCPRSKVREFLGSAHVLAAPTRSTFTEGFAMTVVEGVLAGRPVVTSRVCPSMHYVRPAVVEVEPDSADSLRDAIVALATDRDRLARLCDAARGAGAAFLDPSAGWGAAMEQVVRRVLDGEPVEPVSWLPSAGGTS